MQKINLPTPPQINHSFKEIGSHVGGGMKTGIFMTHLAVFGAGYGLNSFYNHFFKKKKKKNLRIPLAISLISVALIAILPLFS